MCTQTHTYSIYKSQGSEENPLSTAESLPGFLNAAMLAPLLSPKRSRYIKHIERNTRGILLLSRKKDIGNK